MAVRIQIRNGTAEEWAEVNPILAVGELALEIDTRKFKIGDGIHAWNDLPYATQGERGPAGPQGKGLEFLWDGTKLGVRVEGELNYQYVDLQGPKGEKGDPGDIENLTKQHVTDALGYTPVNKAGDTMTGPLALTGSNFDTEFKADNWNLINKYTGGGWAKGLLNVKNKDGTNYIQIGGFGSGQNFTRLYIGKAWNDWLLGINPNNNTVEVQGNLTKNGKEVATKEDIPTESGGGTTIVTSPTEPTGLTTGDQWHKEY